MDNLAPALVLGRVIEAESTVEGLKARLQRLDRPAGIETDWLSIASPMAGPEAGFVFTPEVDDLAVLGFVGKKGIILGFIYSGTTTPPTDAPGRTQNRFSRRQRADSGRRRRQRHQPF